jgi:hypothetical protein
MGSIPFTRFPLTVDFKSRSPVAQWESACPTSNGLWVQILPGLSVRLAHCQIHKINFKEKQMLRIYLLHLCCHLLKFQSLIAKQLRL